jgi:hypothetical protein
VTDDGTLLRFGFSHGHLQALACRAMGRHAGSSGMDRSDRFEAAGAAHRACQALRRGEQVAAVRQGHGGTWEAVDVRIPPVYPREQDAGAAPARRPALRLVGDGTREAVP